MKTILLINQKGGVGKSTLADLLLWELEKAGIPANFYDLDGQGGVMHDASVIPDAKVSVIDTPGALQEEMGEWVKQADLIIIPTKTTMMDVKPLQRMINIVNKVTSPVIYVEMMWNRFTTASAFEQWLKEETDNNAVILRIAQSEQIAKATAVGMSVIDYAPKSTVAQDCTIFVEQVWKILDL